MASTHPLRVLQNGHQWDRSVVVPLDYTQLTTATKVKIAEIPYNAVITALETIPTTTFTNAITMQFAYETPAGSSTNISTAATVTTAASRTSVTVSAVPQFTTPMLITAVPTFSSTNTAGKVLVRVSYVVEGRVDEQRGAN